MFFLKNTFVLFYVGLEKKKNSNLTFKDNYKLYLFFKNRSSYFSRFFSLFNILGVSTSTNQNLFFYVNFIKFIFEKNFNHNKFFTKLPEISTKTLVFVGFFFLNKTFRIKVNKNTFSKSFRKSNFWKKFNFFFKKKKFPRYFWLFKKYVSDSLYLEKKNKRLGSKKNSDFVVNYSGTSLGKYLNDSTTNNTTFYFLRKTKMFNKGRYSRNRQNYRTGVYWCLYINIMVFCGLYLYFYRFTLNFGYLWWLLFSLFASFFFPRMVKFRLYEPRVFLKVLLKSQPLIFSLFKRV